MLITGLPHYYSGRLQLTNTLLENTGYTHYNNHRGCLTMGHHPLIMVRIDTDELGLEVKGVLAVRLVPQLILVQVRPAPDLGIHHMRESLPTSHLEMPNGTGIG